MLTGYKIYDGNGGLIKTINRNDFSNKTYSINLTSSAFSAKEELHIYPIFENIQVYRIEINSSIYDTDNMISGVYHVLDGDWFDFDLELEGNTLYAASPNTSGAKTKTFYTRINEVSGQDYAFMGLTSSDLRGVDLSLLKVTQSSLTHHDKENTSGAGRVKSGSSYYYNIRFQPNSDVVLNQDWRKASRTVTYVCKEISSDYSLKSSYSASNVSSKTITYAMIDGMLYWPSVSAPYDSTYFFVSAYYSNSACSNTSIIVNSIDLDTVYYKASHKVHLMTVNAGSGSAYQTNSCYEQNYQKSQCVYCYKVNTSWGNYTGKESHAYEDQKGDYTPDYTSGYAYDSSVSYTHSKVDKICSRCNKSVSSGAVNCSFSVRGNNDSERHEKYCESCNGLYLENHNFGDAEYVWAADKQHDLYKTCKACNERYVQDRKDCMLVLHPKLKGTTATCTSAGTAVYMCKFCKGGWIEGTPVDPNNHESIKTDSKAATCTAGGYTEKTCTACKTQISYETKAALGHSYSVQTRTNNKITDGWSSDILCIYGIEEYNDYKCTRTGCNAAYAETIRVLNPIIHTSGGHTVYQKYAWSPICERMDYYTWCYYCHCKISKGATNFWGGKSLDELLAEQYWALHNWSL